AGPIRDGLEMGASLPALTAADKGFVPGDHALAFG
ncbi:MAG: hypothetical protein RIQ83_3748, partial [Pseudomonadota bacterium]